MSERDDRRVDLDARVERELRGMLKEREPGPAPLGLRDRVDSVPDPPRATGGGRARLSGPTLAIAGLAAAAVLVFALGSLLRLGPPVAGPGASPGGPAGAPPGAAMPPGAPWVDPTLTPSWASSDQIDLLTALPVLLLLAGGVRLAAWAVLGRSGTPQTVTWREHRLILTPRRQAIAWLGLGVLLAGTALVSQPLSVVTVNESGGPFLVGDVSAPEGSQVTAPHPGQVSELGVIIANRGLLPVTILRPEPWADPAPLQPERFVTQLLPADLGAALPPPGPVTIWPGQQAFFRVLYRHQSCESMGIPATPVATPMPTFGPDGSLPPLPDGATFLTRTDLPLAVSVAGLPRRIDLETGFGFGMLVPTICPRAQPLASMNLSRVPPGLELAPGGDGSNWGGIYGPDQIQPPGPPLVLFAGGGVAAALGLLLLVAPRRRKVALGAAIAVVVMMTAWAGQAGSLVEGSTRAGGLGLTLAGGPGFNADTEISPEVYNVEPDGILTFQFSLRNPGPVPLTLIGSPRLTGQLALTGLGRPWRESSTNPEDYIVLMPGTVLEPGQEISVLGVARAGSCARPLADKPDGSVIMSGIPFTWEALGLRHQSTVTLSRSISVPADAACLLAAGGAAGSDGRATTASFPALAGPGISTRTDAGLGPLFLVISGLIVLAAVAARLRGRWRLLPIPGIVLLVAYWAIGVLVPIRIGEFAAARGPNVREAVMPPGATEVLWHEVAPSGAPFAVGIGLYAESPLPVRLESIYEPSDREGFIGMRWRAVWLSDVSGGGFWDPARPFTSVDLGPLPGIWLVGQAGACAVGPSFDPANLPADLGGYTSREIDLNVSVLGWPRTVRLEPKFKLVEPDRNGCSALNPTSSSPASSSPSSSSPSSPTP